MSNLVEMKRDGEAAVIIVTNPPVNALSPGVPEGIAEFAKQAEADAGVRAIVLIGGGQTFIAGADIKEFGRITSGEKDRISGIHPLIDTLENCAKPVIAAIHGTAFGGGLEVAMSCHYRVALADAQVGQPEVKLGIIPGAGGTQRLPRLAGFEKAVEMCAFGDPVKAPAAHECGVVDRIVEGSDFDALLAGAMGFAREVIAGGDAPPKSSERNEKLADFDRGVFDAARARAAQKLRGWMSPLKAIEAVEAAATLPFAEGIKREAGLFNECLYSDQSKALIHAFFGEREVRKIPGIPKDAPIAEIRSAAIVGAGTMGGGIAMNYLNAGIAVVLKEATGEALERGVATIRKNYERSVERGRFKEEFAERSLSLLTPTLSYDGFEKADIVVEAVFEGMELKKQVFSEIDAVARPGAILATNTSTLNIDEIASATSRPEAVIGHHYFSPANVMRLLEIVRGKATSNGAIATSMALAKRLRKVGVLVGNCRGFVGNRMFGPYRREAQFLVEEGARVADVDKSLYDFGMAMGPLAVGDLAGLDVGWRIRKEYRHLEPPGERQPLAEDHLCELGRYGQKTGAGWYRYDDKRNRIDDPESERIVRQFASDAGIEQREIGTAEMADRTVYALVNEGARILEEGYALRAVDIDIIYLNGYGFPPYRGGPMWHADTVGLARVLSRIREFHERQGYWWRPAPLLEDLAGAGKTFAQWDRERQPAA